jgi:hypothetical protein
MNEILFGLDCRGILSCRPVQNKPYDGIPGFHGPGWCMRMVLNRFGLNYIHDTGVL